MSKRCSILVNSCDAFNDVWDLFFKALDIQWPDCSYDIYLSTETKKYDNNMGVKVLNYLPKNGKDCWGKRLKVALSKIETDYVMIVLDDFVLSEAFTGQSMIESVMNWMDENQEIGVFYIHKHPYVIQEKTPFEGFGEMPQKCDYKLTTGIAIWRKEYLNKCLKGIETPWEWELYATKRAWRFIEKEYALLESEEEVYKYQFGGVIWRGKWHPEVVKLAEKYGIEIDYNVRGFLDMNDPYGEKDVYILRRNINKIYTIKFWKVAAMKIRDRIRRLICRI